MATLIDGKAVSAEIKNRIRNECNALRENRGEQVALTVILVGEDPASQVYVRLKEKASLDVGIKSNQITLPEDTTERELLDLIKKLNNDTSVNGILVQLPLPSHLDENIILDRIDPNKDVDGFHPTNVGLLSQKLAKLMPCTPAGCMELLDHYHVNIDGANAVVIGRSNIVGKPIATMLLHRNATVTICHSRTKNLAEIAGRADILIAAIGRPKFVTADMVKEGSAVIDVGISRVGGKLVGDVDFEPASKKAEFITPVPGGVGPMTIAMLLYNTLLAYKIQRGLLV